MQVAFNIDNRHIILCVEESLLSSLIAEFENETSDGIVEYFVIDPVEFSEVKTSLRRVVAVDVSESNTVLVSVGYKEVVENYT